MRSEREAIRWELLVLRIRRGDMEAMAELIQAWEQRLLYYLRRLLSEEQDAWDTLQETWEKVLRGIRGLRDPRALPAWLYRIAHNTAMSHLRRRRSQDLSINGDESPQIATDNSEHIPFEDAEWVHWGLGQLSVAHREVLTLHFLEDFSVEEIATVVGVASGTVKSRLHHARRALRAVLEKEDRGHV